MPQSNGQHSNEAPKGLAATLRPDIPLPGHHTGSRIMRLNDLNIPYDDWLKAAFTFTQEDLQAAADALQLAWQNYVDLFGHHIHEMMPNFSFTGSVEEVLGASGDENSKAELLTAYSKIHQCLERVDAIRAAVVGAAEQSLQEAQEYLAAAQASAGDAVTGEILAVVATAAQTAAEAQEQIQSVSVFDQVAAGGASGVSVHHEIGTSVSIIREAETTLTKIAAGESGDVHSTIKSVREALSAAGSSISRRSEFKAIRLRSGSPSGDEKSSESVPLNTPMVMRAKDWAGRDYPVIYDPRQGPAPMLALVEVFGVSSFLSDDGAGKTVKTISLLPGEEMRITLKTWRSSEKTIKEGSTIFDSEQSTAKARFQDQLTKQTETKETQSEQENWKVSASAKASWGFGSASVSGEAGGQYQAGREEFAKQVSDSVAEHAAEATAKRELSVTSSAEETEKSGYEENTERVIRNVNMRRVLNFVFRELNQAYDVKIHLKEVRVGFTNGKLGTYREVPISDLRGLLRSVLKPERADVVAADIVRIAGVVFDVNDSPQIVLDRVSEKDDGSGWTVEPATLVNGGFPAPTPKAFYRFKRGPIGQTGEANPVAGVIMKTTRSVLLTDSVVIEALLGASDALDEYALEVQQAAAASKTLANRRETLIHEALAAVSDPAERCKFMPQLMAPQAPEKTQ